MLFGEACSLTVCFVLVACVECACAGFLGVGFSGFSLCIRLAVFLSGALFCMGRVSVRVVLGTVSCVLWVGKL